MPSQREPYLTAKLQGFGTTIFAEMSALAVATDSINLGQGFPDTDAPREILDAAIAGINGGLNQYPPGPGMPVLRQAIAAHQQRFYGLSYDVDTEVLVTAGATEALAGAESKNRELYGIGRQLLDAYRRGGGEGVFGLDAVKLENEAEALRTEIEARRLVSGATR